MTDHLRQAMRAAVQCNNMAATLIEASHLQDALDVARGAAVIMQGVHECLINEGAFASLNQQQRGPVSPAPQEPSQTSSVIPEMSAETIEKAEEEVELMKQRAAASATSAWLLQQEHSFFFSKPIRLDDREPNLDDLIDCSVVSATIVYNMGLANHMCGTESHIREASNLFQLAFTLAVEAGSTDPRCQKIVLAALNNTGEIYHFFGEYQMAQELIDTLYKFVSTLPPVADAETMKDRHQILLNSMLLRQPKFASAA